MNAIGRLLKVADNTALFLSQLAVPGFYSKEQMVDFEIGIKSI